MPGCGGGNDVPRGDSRSRSQSPIVDSANYLKFDSDAPDEAVAEARSIHSDCAPQLTPVRVDPETYGALPEQQRQEVERQVQQSAPLGAKAYNICAEDRVGSYRGPGNLSIVETTQGANAGPDFLYAQRGSRTSEPSTGQRDSGTASGGGGEADVAKRACDVPEPTSMNYFDLSIEGGGDCAVAIKLVTSYSRGPNMCFLDDGQGGYRQVNPCDLEGWECGSTTIASESTKTSCGKGEVTVRWVSGS